MTSTYPLISRLGASGSQLRTASVGRLELFEIQYRAGTVEAQHEHPFASIVLVLGGRIRASSRYRSLVQDQQEVRTIPARTPHGNRYETDVRTFVAHIDTRSVDDSTAALGGTVKVVPKGDLVSCIVGRMYQEFSSRDAAWEMAAESLFWELLVCLVRGQQNVVGDLSPLWMRRVLDRLRSTFRERQSVEAIAEDVGIHPVHLGRTFRRQQGCSVSEYVRALRLESARHALLCPEGRIAEIAVANGFADQSQLTRAFRARYGVTPADYRRRVAPVVPSSRDGEAANR